MRQRFAFASIALAAAAWTPEAGAADFQFPSVPVGQRMQAEFTVTAGQTPLGGLDVSLAVPGRCGLVVPDRVTTDSSGKGRFEFIAGNQPGVCTITGSSNGTTLSGQTTIFRPEDVVVGGRPLIDDTYWLPGRTEYFALTLSAAGLPLPFVAVALGQFGAGGPTLTGGTHLTTDAAGAFRVDVVEGSAAGIFDLPMSVAGQTRHLRLVQRMLPEYQQRLPYRQTVQASADPAVVVLPDAAAGSCAMGGAVKSSVQAFGAPPGMVEFFNDLIDLRVTCTGAPSARVRIEYPEPIPSDAEVLQYTIVTGTGVVWKRLPAEITGNAVTFTIPELRDGGIFREATVGLALPGAGPAPQPPRVHDMWWAGPAENGWGMSIVQGRGNNKATFAAIFAYDAAGEPTWWVMTLGDWRTGRGAQFSAPAYSPTGTPWFNYETGLIHVGDPAGRVQLRFADADNGELAFTLHGISGTKPIHRMLFGNPASSRPDVSGLWWGGYSQNGWGISVLQQGEKLFSIWYTYDAANKPVWFVMPDGRWTSATTFEGRIYRPRGSAWLGAAYDPSKLGLTDVGAFTLNFAAGAGTFAYSIDGRAGSVRIERNQAY